MTCRCATDIERCRDGLSEVSRGHSRCIDRTEGPNVKRGRGTGVSMVMAEAEDRAEMSGAQAEGSEQYSPEQVMGASNTAATTEHSLDGKMSTVMEAVVERENMRLAYSRVMRNKGAAGVDQMPVADLKAHLKVHWPQVKKALLAGRYQPRPVRSVSIPKPGGRGERLLGIPTVMDRLIQHALHQVLSPIFERHFSEFSYGFRPGRHARQAVQQARLYVSEGRRWVVDLDLEKFFDRVNHDILMSRVARRTNDQRVLGLIRGYLQAGLLSGGVISPRREGTPQGGPLSPLLSNILLDDLDWELERRGHAFCRYADDCAIYVRTKRSGERVMASLSQYLETRLQLPVNTTKSVEARPWQRTYLGYSMTFHRQPRLKVAVQAVARLRSKLRAVFRRGRAT